VLAGFARVAVTSVAETLTEAWTRQMFKINMFKIKMLKKKGLKS
jgi:hypothetical protein